MKKKKYDIIERDFLIFFITISLIFIMFTIILVIQNINLSNKNLELNNKINTNLKFFDCRSIQRDDIIIGIENQSLLFYVKDRFTFNFTEDYLIDNPFVCKDNECKQLMFNESEEADWMIENSYCDFYIINLRRLI